MAEAPTDPPLEPLAERLLEVLVTHNEPVASDDLACALGVPEQQVWNLAARLKTLGLARLDEPGGTVEASEAATD